MERERVSLRFLTLSVGCGIKSPLTHQEPAWILDNSFSFLEYEAEFKKKDKEEVI